MALDLHMDTIFLSVSQSHGLKEPSSTMDGFVLSSHIVSDSISMLGSRLRASMYLSGVTGHGASSAHTGQCPAFCPASVPEVTKEEAQLL